MKHHPYYRKLLSNGERIAYGARTVNEGGFQAIPQLYFPGGALIGCSAGFVNVAKIKGVHYAMKSGMLAAEAAHDAITSSSTNPSGYDMSKYEESIRDSWVWSDLKEVRNSRPSFNTRFGRWGGIAYNIFETLILKGKAPWTLHNTVSDAKHTKPAR